MTRSRARDKERKRDDGKCIELFCELIKMHCTWEFCRIWLIAANEAMQWPGFLWWFACGSMSSFIGSGLKSHGVCVELLVTVISSALAIVPLVTDDAVELRKKKHRQREKRANVNRKSNRIRSNNFTKCWAEKRIESICIETQTKTARKKNHDIDSAVTTVTVHFNLICTFACKQIRMKCQQTYIFDLMGRNIFPSIFIWRCDFPLLSAFYIQ